MHRAYRLRAFRAATLTCALLGGGVGLASCGSVDGDGAASPRDGWDYGGQTGSLMPVCGLTPASLQRGVPASAPGLLLLPSQCDDARVLDALTVRDASGQPIPFELEPLPGGELLVTFPNGLTPGDYVIGVPQPGDEDGGVEAAPTGVDVDAGVGGEPALQSVTVEASAPLPMRFGEVARIGGACGATLELMPDSDVLPFLGSLSVEIQIDGGATQTLVLTGTLKLVDGRARVALPEYDLSALDFGEHELRVTMRLAGESAPLETFLLTLSVPCDDGELAEAEPVGTCSAVLGPRGSMRSMLATACAAIIGLFALRKRGRRARS